MSFEKILSQPQACAILKSALENQRVPHAYLFLGPEGVGKRTTALQWAKTLNCLSPVSPVRACDACASCRKIDSFSHPDVLWINYEFQARFLDEPLEKQNSLKIKTIAEMSRLLRLRSMEGRVKLAFVDPADRLGEDAAHSLLKILEEPPPMTHLVLFAEDASQLLGTIRSRSQWVRFRPLPTDVVAEFIKNSHPELSEEEARRLAFQAEGSLGKALRILEEGEEMEFDWESVPISELLSWCEQFPNSAEGRSLAGSFLRGLLARRQLAMHEGRGDAESVQGVLEAIHQVRQNVSPQLVLEVLLLKSRWEKRNREKVA